MKRVTEAEIKQAAEAAGLTYAELKTFIAVESSGRGFSDTGKLIIQFEPHLFKKNAAAEYQRYIAATTGTDREAIKMLKFTWQPVLENKIDVQSREWAAFNAAFSINREAAMRSTSIGLPQILGSHFARLGFTSAGAMWDYFKAGEVNHVHVLARFIATDARLFRTIKARDWHMVATLYNGKYYRELAVRIGREPYDISLAKAFRRYS
ncbi:MAG: DUF3380 domain-containing protein [Mucilaginibacter polytrichastri]|nr:DUF3380 domain-containing protein [Mucilaginibacter polytrichastri]